MRHIPLCLLVPFVLACEQDVGPPFEPTIQLEGTVTAATDGSPMAGAGISVGYFTDGLSSTTVAGGLTDATGHYALSFETKGIGCQEYNVLVSASLFLPILSFDALRCTNRVQTLDFQLDRS